MSLSLVQSMLLGAGDISQGSLTTWVVGAVLTAVTGTLAFLVRSAFGKVETTLEVVVKKLDTMTEAFARADGDRRVLEQRVATMEREISELKRELKELSEGVAR